MRSVFAAATVRVSVLVAWAVAYLSVLAPASQLVAVARLAAAVAARSAAPVARSVLVPVLVPVSALVAGLGWVALQPQRYRPY